MTIAHVHICWPGNVDRPHVMADFSSESDSDSPVIKKTKYAEVAKYKSKFKNNWIVKYPFVSSVTSDKSLFHCNVCNRTLSCAHQGEADLKHHIASDGHTALAKEQAKQLAITSFLRQPNSNIHEKARTWSFQWNTYCFNAICSTLCLANCKTSNIIAQCWGAVRLFIQDFWLQ